EGTVPRGEQLLAVAVRPAVGHLLCPPLRGTAGQERLGGSRVVQAVEPVDGRHVTPAPSPSRPRDLYWTPAAGVVTIGAGDGNAAGSRAGSRSFLREMPADLRHNDLDGCRSAVAAGDA